jgi:hypothetical protein
MAFSRSLSSAKCGHANDRDVTGLGISLEGTHGFPAVTDWHFEVHQNYVWVLGRWNFQPFSLSYGENLEIANFAQGAP